MNRKHLQKIGLVVAFAVGLSGLSAVSSATAYECPERKDHLASKSDYFMTTMQQIHEAIWAELDKEGTDKFNQGRLDNLWQQWNGVSKEFWSLQGCYEALGLQAPESPNLGDLPS